MKLYIRLPTPPQWQKRKKQKQKNPGELGGKWETRTEPEEKKTGV